jgi:hypothetical protein
MRKELAKTVGNGQRITTATFVKLVQEFVDTLPKDNETEVDTEHMFDQFNTNLQEFFTKKGYSLYHMRL